MALAKPFLWLCAVICMAQFADSQEPVAPEKEVTFFDQA